MEGKKVKNVISEVRSIVMYFQCSKTFQTLAFDLPWSGQIPSWLQQVELFFVDECKASLNFLVLPVSLWNRDTF